MVWFNTREVGKYVNWTNRRFLRSITTWGPWSFLWQEKLLGLIVTKRIRPTLISLFCWFLKHYNLKWNLKSLRGNRLYILLNRDLHYVNVPNIHPPSPFLPNIQIKPLKKWDGEVSTIKHFVTYDYLSGKFRNRNMTELLLLCRPTTVYECPREYFVIVKKKTHYLDNLRI